MPEQALRLRRYCGERRGEFPVYCLGTIGFWGGIDVTTGTIVDALHPRRGLSLSGAICVIDATRGSTAGPGALIEWICGECAPSALLTFPPNLSLAVVAETLALLDKGDAVLGEFLQPVGADTLAAWDGGSAVLQGDRIIRRA